MEKPIVGSVVFMNSPKIETPDVPKIVRGVVVNVPERFSCSAWATNSDVVWALWENDTEPLWVGMAELVGATCSLCKKPVNFKDGQWRSDDADFPQYCWVDPSAGSQLHGPLLR
jgi:hypothetical protein